MALLVGQEAEGTAGTASIVSETAWSFDFKAAKTGKVNALHVIFSESGAGTGGRIALQADEAGKPKEGVLTEGNLTSVTAGAHEASVAEVEVVEGTTYWLSVLPTGGAAKMKGGATTNRGISGTKHPKISEITAAQWTITAAKGPGSIWATGTEAGGVLQVAVTVKVSLKDTPAAVQAQAIAATSRVTLKDTMLVGQAQAVAAVSKVTVKTVASVLQQLAVAGVTQVRFLGSGAPTQTMSVAAAAKVRFKGTATVRLVETGGKKVAIFIFED